MPSRRPAVSLEQLRPAELDPFRLARLEAEEAVLVADLRAARARAAAVAVFAGVGRAERADRAEAHLSRELDRTLDQLTRIRALRRRPSGSTS